MSIISYFVLVLLCFSFYACDARSFGVASTTKKNEKLNPQSVSKQPDSKSSVSKTIEGANQENKFEDKKANLESSASNTESLTTSVSWRVPHEKKGEPEIPGFNLDYLPPKTHPPVHN